MPSPLQIAVAESGSMAPALLTPSVTDRRAVRQGVQRHRVDQEPEHPPIGGQG
jgi:hypothetical protein